MLVEEASPSILFSKILAVNVYKMLSKDAKKIPVIPGLNFVDVVLGDCVAVLAMTVNLLAMTVKM